MTATKPTPRRLLKLIERAQLLRRDLEEMRDAETPGDRRGFIAGGAASALLDSLYAWNDALRATSSDEEARGRIPSDAAAGGTSVTMTRGPR